MKRIGITGAEGWIGTHLRETLRLHSEEYVPFRREWFEQKEQLTGFLSRCDAVVHLAAVSRSPNPQEMYATNMRLTAALAEAAADTEPKPHIFFASTTHDAKETPYHASKRDGRKLLEEFGARHGFRTTTLRMPNCFGPCGRPFWNSFLSTLCYLRASGKAPERVSDDIVELISMEELCRAIHDLLLRPPEDSVVTIPATLSEKVSAIDALFLQFHQELDAGKIPQIRKKSEAALFNTYYSYYITLHS